MQICNKNRRTYLHCARITFADRMAAFCSFSAITGGKCGSHRGCVDFVCLNICNADISSELMNHHLSRENVCEMDLILARAGLLELTDDQIKNMTVCPVHRYTLGKYWQAPKTCQYPKHHGKKMAIAGTHVIYFKTAREIKNIFGEAVPVGSRKSYKTSNYNCFILSFYNKQSELKSFVFLHILFVI